MSEPTRYVESELLDARLHDRILVVAINRPERANAFDAATMRELTLLWRKVAGDPQIRCLVFTGTGKAFCAGGDVTMLSAERTAVGDDAADELSFVPGRTVQVPIIAAVNGMCAGGGLHFVGDADIAIAAESARFVDPHVSVGQVTALEPLDLFPRMRPDRLIRMALLGRYEMLDAAAALDAGLVSEVVPDEQLLERAMELAGLIAKNSPEAVRLTRRVLRTYRTNLIGGQADLGWELIRRHREHPDALEGPAAFLEKREANWSEPSPRRV